MIMSNKSEQIMDGKSIISNVLGWLFGFLVLAIGTVNVFWGNDPEVRFARFCWVVIFKRNFSIRIWCMKPVKFCQYNGLDNSKFLIRPVLQIFFRFFPGESMKQFPGSIA